jgi:AcrR family transcriptional regulator
MSMKGQSAAPGGLGLRERNKLDKLRRIKDAARDLFLAKGFDEATTREIAVRAGVGLGTLFVYAENKRDLLFLIVNDELEKIERSAAAAVAESNSLLDNLLAVFALHYAFFMQQPALSRLVLREMLYYESGVQAARFQKTRERLINLLGRIVAIALAQGSIRSLEPPDFIGWVLFSVFQVQLRHWLAQENPDLESGLHALERALRLVIEGLAPKEAALARSSAPHGRTSEAGDPRAGCGGAEPGPHARMRR